MTDINREVAEKVMGWKRDIISGLWFENDHTIARFKEFNPPTNISDAWLVVERMRELGFTVDIDNMTSSGVISAPYNELVSYWTVVFEPMYGNPATPPPDDHFYGVADTAPLAICQAALKALA